jgi:hypothetical protein
MVTALADTGGLAVVVGPAGGGKTAALATATKTWRSGDRPVARTTLAAVTARRLERAAGIRARHWRASSPLPTPQTRTPASPPVSPPKRARRRRGLHGRHPNLGRLAHPHRTSGRHPGPGRRSRSAARDRRQRAVRRPGPPPRHHRVGRQPPANRGMGTSGARRPARRRPTRRGRRVRRAWPHPHHVDG